MHVWGFIVNTITVIIGSLLGMVGGSKLPESIRKIILSALGLSTILIGTQMAIGTSSLILVVGSLLAGGIAGQVIGIEEWLERIGERLRKRFEPQQRIGNSENLAAGQVASSFVFGFVTASLLFCTGPMTIVGSLEDGFAGNPNLIYIKSVMDGVAAIVLTASLGRGVIFAAATVLLFQGALTFIGMILGGALGEIIINEIRATGGALIFGIGLNLLGIAKIKVGNFVPALIFAGLFAWWFLR